MGMKDRYLILGGDSYNNWQPNPGGVIKWQDNRLNAARGPGFALRCANR